ncbi:hypothetical protein [Streptomyces lydicus]|uniref:Uncharacterized protein n=1 Tax=Streptomyces lydicus TaxID=47763 RepID=A0A1D7VPR6_9ACTN|nr:hypothetical protein [Streptomyces lydicus]AOP48752.1 hypothetical protein SL103_23110 [Streptomyces lydicus]
MGGGRRTRPWGPLRGASERDNQLADTLRRWLDAAGLKVDDLRACLRPEHFVSQTVPSRTTVSDRLAGVNLQWDFVEAVADACSGDARQCARLLAEARTLLARLPAAAPPGGADRPPAAAPEPERRESPERTAELVAAQRQALALSDKLLRAMERSAELEQARNSANHMVLILLAMVDTLRRDIATLTAERERVRAARKDQELLRVRERLQRSETQRSTAESELTRARAEREKADRLAERAAEQVRALRAELDGLRGRPGEPAPPAARPAGPADAGDDIDRALFKAARTLDGEADHLQRLAAGLPGGDAPDIPATWDDGPDIVPDNSAGSGPAPAGPVDSGADAGDALSGRATGQVAPGRPGAGQEVTAPAPERVRAGDREDLHSAFRSIGRNGSADEVLALVRALAPEDAHPLLAAVGGARPAKPFREVLDTLRAAGRDAEVRQILTAVGRHRAAREFPLVFSALKGGRHDAARPFAQERDIQWVLESLVRERPGEVQAVFDRLVLTRRDHEADWLWRLARPVVALTPRGGTAPAPPAPAPDTTAADWFAPRRPIGDPSRSREPAPVETTLTTRIKINIPGTRPVPPVVVRKPADRRDAGTG